MKFTLICHQMASGFTSSKWLHKQLLSGNVFSVCIVCVNSVEMWRHPGKNRPINCNLEIHQTKWSGPLEVIGSCHTTKAPLLLPCCSLISSHLTVTLSAHMKSADGFGKVRWNSTCGCYHNLVQQFQSRLWWEQYVCVSSFMCWAAVLLPHARGQ